MIHVKSKDGKQKYSFSDRSAIQHALVPLWSSFGMEWFLAEDSQKLFEKIEFALSDLPVTFWNDVVFDEVTWGIICIKKEWLTLEVVVEEIKQGTMITRCFSEYIGHGAIDSVFDNEEMSIVDVNDQFNIVHSLTTNEQKFDALKNLLGQLGCRSDVNSAEGELIKDVASRIRDVIKPEEKNQILFYQCVIAGVLQVHYKMEFDVVLNMAKENKAIDHCFDLYLKEIVTTIMSEQMGEPPVSTLQ